MDVGCNWSWLPGCGSPDGLCHLLVQEDQKKESKERNSSRDAYAMLLCVFRLVVGMKENGLLKRTKKNCVM